MDRVRKRGTLSRLLTPRVRGGTIFCVLCEHFASTRQNLDRHSALRTVLIKHRQTKAVQQVIMLANNTNNICWGTIV